MSELEPEEYGEGYRCAECWELFHDTEAFDMHLRGDPLSPECCHSLLAMRDMGLIRGRGGYWYFPATRRCDYARTRWDF